MAVAKHLGSLRVYLTIPRFWFKQKRCTALHSPQLFWIPKIFRIISSSETFLIHALRHPFVGRTTTKVWTYQDISGDESFQWSYWPPPHPVMGATKTYKNPSSDLWASPALGSNVASSNGPPMMPAPLVKQEWTNTACEPPHFMLDSHGASLIKQMITNANSINRHGWWITFTISPVFSCFFLFFSCFQGF